MARPYVCLLALAAVLLLGIAAVSRSKGLRGKGQGHQRAPRIPSQFSQEERVAMKEALKGEPGSPSPLILIHRSLSPRANPRLPSTATEVGYSSSSSATPHRRALAPFTAPRARLGEPILLLDLASGDSSVSSLPWKLQLCPYPHYPTPTSACLEHGGWPQSDLFWKRWLPVCQGVITALGRTGQGKESLQFLREISGPTPAGGWTEYPPPSFGGCCHITAQLL